MIQSNPHTRSSKVRHDIPKRLTFTNFHSTRFQQIVNHLSNHIGDLSSSAKRWNQKALEVSEKEFGEMLQSRLKEISSSFDECLQVLAEEQRSSRQWRLKFEKLQEETSRNSSKMHSSFACRSDLNRKSESRNLPALTNAMAENLGIIAYIPSAKRIRDIDRAVCNTL